MEFIIDDNIALTYEDLIDCANNGAHSGKLEIPQVGILEFSKKFFCDLNTQFMYYLYFNNITFQFKAQ